MFLKKLKLTNYRKFYLKKNVVEFISSKIVENHNGDNLNGNNSDSDVETEVLQADVASDTTLIIGKNNAGKTTIITALDNLINHEERFGENDFNYKYLRSYLKNYNVSNPPTEAPYIEFIITIGLDESSNDRISNLIPFMLVEDIKDSELNICIRYEVKDLVYFQARLNILLAESKKNDEFLKFLDLLHDTDYTLNYYDKDMNKIDTNFKLSNLIEIQCIKANHIKNDHCLTDSFNKIISYRYNNIFQDEKKKVSKELDKINLKLTKNIEAKHTTVIKNVMNELTSMKNLGVNLSADITFDKLMKDLIKYQYIDGKASIPEDQFGLGYTSLVMIIAAIMDYMERYPDSSFNSKINLISIEEPETFMHPQMQELFIKNINDAIRVLLSSRNKNVNSQIIITTHSSHILNSKIHSKNTFNNICYLHNEDNNSTVTNLNNEIVMPSKNSVEKLQEFNFLKKHIKYKVSELFFSDAAIFVEGFAEDMLIPYYIENMEKLNKHFVSIFNINGAHGFLYKELIYALGIPVLIITDLDIKRSNKKGEKKKVKTQTQISCLDGKKTTNATIKDMYGKDDISCIPKNIVKRNIYLAYQGKINGYYATSFEEAYILTNYNNIIVNKLLKEIKPNVYTSIVGVEENYEKNKENSYIWQMKLEKHKGEFASKLLYKIVNEDNDENIPKLPEYIMDGLNWLEKKLGGTNGII